MPTDPAILRSIASPSQPGPGAAHPGAPGGIPGAPGGEADKPKEPASLADACSDASESVGAASDALDELVAQAEVDDSIDPKVEKLLIKCADGLAKVKEDLETAGTKLSEAKDKRDKLATDGPGD